MMVYYKDFDFTTLPDVDIIRGKKYVYLNGDFGVDIETTSFYHEGKKRAYCYMCMVNVCGNYIYCRTLDELSIIFHNLKIRYNLHGKRRMIMYVHNLAFEFQFFRDICNFSEVFARAPRKPIKSFDDKSGIEFRCSYILSGLSLAHVAENLKNTNIEKISGDDFDYTKLRHHKTPLTELEMMYCEHDVMILHYYVLQELEKNGNNITKIPLTQTGYVRRECRNEIFNNVNLKQYRSMIRRNSPDENLFILLNKTFAGGDTHANYLHVKQKIENVYSFDFASSYPTVMVKCKFPYHFTKCEIYNMETFRNLLNKKACLFKCSFEHIKAKRHHHILSLSKCETSRNEIIDNGRIVQADYVTTFFTDIDFKDFENFYNYDKIRIIEFYYADYNYLPTPFVKYILKLFEHKTTLKGLKGELNEALYLKAKQYINGLYGMCVTNIVNDEIVFNDEWEKNHVDIAETLEKYKNSYNSFLLYQWGVWVTSYARHYLRDTIAKIEDNSEYIDDFIYCDTDSIKITNYERHKKIIDEYNKQNIKELQTALEYHGIDKNAIFQKTKKGKIKTLGIWENETPKPYIYFKTLGAKRYMYFAKHEYKILNKISSTKQKVKTRRKVKINRDEYHLTVSGLNKKKATPYIVKHGNFDFFNDNMYIPPKHTGKQTHTYIDEHYEIDMIDYLGNVARVSATHYIHLEEQEYTLSLSNIFKKFLFEYSDNDQPFEPDNDKLSIRYNFKLR